MAQFIVRNIEDEVRDRLRALAHRHGRSMEEEVREILRAAVAPRHAPAARFGSQASARFRGCGLKADIAELRGTHVEPPSLGR
jgi:plasmid stability protein